MISDFKDDFAALKDRVAKQEDTVEANMKWTREQIEALQKMCENLEVKVIAVNKIIARLSDKLESSGGQASRSNLLPMKGDGADAELLRKLQQELAALAARVDRSFKDV